MNRDADERAVHIQEISTTQIVSGLHALSTDHKLSLYNACIVTGGAVFAAVAWFPDHTAKRGAALEYSIVRDNPTGVMRTRDLRTLPDGRHLYDVAYELILKNTSSQSFTVEFSVERLFLGHNHYSADDGDAQTLEDPPQIGEESATEGDVASWELMSTEVGISIPHTTELIGQLERAKLFSAKSDYAKDIDPFGGMSGVYDPDHTTGYTAHYLLAARPTDYAAIQITYGITPKPSWKELLTGKRHSSFIDANPNWEIVSLNDATRVKETCLHGVKTQDGATSSACSSADEMKPATASQKPAETK